jgi:hypothetical protein
MMDELLSRVTEKTGLTPDQAQAAVEAVLGVLKERLPAPLASELENLVGGGQSGGEGLADAATAVLGSLFSKMEKPQ